MKRLTTTLLLLLFPAMPASPAGLPRTLPGTRANAMGSAFSTIGGDPYAVFYNPANLTTLSNLEFRFETGRRLSDKANEGEMSLVYIRPYPEKASLIAGAGLYSTRRAGVADSDTAVFAFGDRIMMKYFQQPIFYGGAAKLASLRTSEGDRIGLGADAGIQLGANTGLKTALVLSNVMMGLGGNPATLTLGNSYPLGDALLLADFRAGSGHSELFFGAEYSLFNGLAQARAGKGIALNGGDYLALGLGLNTLPWTIDFTWSLPWKGYNDNSGYYGFTAGYRFGASDFSGNLVGEAARKVEALRTQTSELRQQRTALESSISAYTVNKNVLQGDIGMLQVRARDLEERIKELEAQALQAQYYKENPKPAKRYVPPPPEKWPRQHKVAAGETLRSIASKYYGNPNLWERIYEANEKNVFKGLPAEGSVFMIPAPPAKDGD